MTTYATPGKTSVAVLHYTAPPVVGGVEAVIAAHVRTFRRAGHPVTVIAGRGGPGEPGDAPLHLEADLYDTTGAFIRIPEMDSFHPEILAVGKLLEQGEIPPTFSELADRLAEALAPRLAAFDRVIVHNIFTKHFNLPLTAALARLLESGDLRGCIAWCHDLSWTSQNSRSKVHPGYPWDLLRLPLPGVTYVAVSDARCQELAGLFGVLPDAIRVVYNGVDPQALLGLTAEAAALATRLRLLESDLSLLMPVRVTKAKNMEYALHVTAALKALGFDPRLVVTGPPDPHAADGLAYFHSLKDLRRALGVEGEAHFLYECGPDPAEPYHVDNQTVGALMRLCDGVFLPSHREGFGMPLLEAGLNATPVICTTIPAAQEIGGADVLTFDPAQPAGQTAGQVCAWIEGNPTVRLRRRIRQAYTWEAIFKQAIEPLLTDGTSPRPN